MIAQYGLLSGNTGVYALKYVEAPDYFLTNRYGDFTYRIDFIPGIVDDVVLNLDFWELFGRKSGERRFAIDAKIDNKEWTEAVVLDVAAFANKSPMSVRIDLRRPKTIQLRFRQLPGSADIPFLQGIRAKRVVAGGEFGKIGVKP